MSNQIDEIKSKIDIVSIIGEKVTLKKAGKNFKGLCPFHTEKTPSFIASPDVGIYKCFGCGESGDAISFLEKYEGMSFYEALQFLAQKAGVKLETKGFAGKDPKDKLMTINDLATKFYSYVLLNHQAGRRALAYLTEKRGLKMDTIKRFRLGYSPYAKDALIGFMINRKKYTLTDLEEAGIIYKNANFAVDRFKGRVIFPLTDHRGNTIAFAGRIMPDEKNADLAKYINSPETAIYHKSRVLFGLDQAKEEIRKKGEVIIVEGELDLISSWQAGIKNIVAIKGSALTEDQVRLLSRFTSKIILALDADFAGNKAARRGIEIALDQGMEVRVVDMGGFKDPDEFARNNPGGFVRNVKDSQGVWDFIIDSIFSKFDSNTGTGKAKISDEIIPVLVSISNNIVQSFYTDVAAKRLNVPVSAVSEEIAKFLNKSQKIPLSQPINIDSKLSTNRKESLERGLAALTFQTDPAILKDPEIDEHIDDPLIKKLIDEYRAYIAKQAIFNVADFSNSLPMELRTGFSDLILFNTGIDTDNKASVATEIKSLSRELKLIVARERMTKLAAEIKEIEASGDQEKLTRAEKEFSQVSKILKELGN